MEENTFYLKIGNTTKTIKFEVEEEKPCDIPSILLMNSTCVENCISTSDPDVGNPVMNPQQGIIDPILIKALTLFLETPEGQDTFGLFMDTGQQIILGGKPVYTATCQGDFYNKHALHFIESTNLQKNAYADTTYEMHKRYVTKGFPEDYFTFHAKRKVNNKLYYNKVQKLRKSYKRKYLKLIIKVYMKEFKSPSNTGDWSQDRLIAQMCHTIGHEFFIHGYRSVIPAMKAWNADDLEAYDKIAQINSGYKGNHDHAAYIQQGSDYGLQQMRAFQQSLQQLIGKPLFAKVEKSHDKKYLKFKNTDIPPSNTNNTKY